MDPRSELPNVETHALTTYYLIYSSYKKGRLGSIELIPISNKSTLRDILSRYASFTGAQKTRRNLKGETPNIEFNIYLDIDQNFKLAEDVLEKSIRIRINKPNDISKKEKKKEFYKKFGVLTKDQYFELTRYKEKEDITIINEGNFVEEEMFSKN